MVALNKRTGETIWKSIVPDRVSGGQTQNRGFGGGNRPSAIQSLPVLSSLDKDQNKEISTDELAEAPTVLLTLDKNKDGKLSEDEISPGGGGGDSQGGQRRRRGPGMMRMNKALSALDADENNVIDEAEIKVPNSMNRLKKMSGEAHQVEHDVAARNL